VGGWIADTSMGGQQFFGCIVMLMT